MTRSTERRFGLDNPTYGLAKIVNDVNVANADIASRAAVEETSTQVSTGGIDRGPSPWWRNGQKEAAE